MIEDDEMQAKLRREEYEQKRKELKDKAAVSDCSHVVSMLKIDNQVEQLKRERVTAALQGAEELHKTKKKAVKLIEIGALTTEEATRIVNADYESFLRMLSPF